MIVMTRYSAETIMKIKRLRKEGGTLTEIVAESGLPKGSVFEYIKDIPKSDYLKEKLARLRTEHHTSIAGRLRGKSKKNWSFVQPATWSPQFVNVMAHFIFDGTMNRTSFTYNNRSLALIDQVMAVMKELLDVVDFKFYRDQKSGVMRVAYFNVELATFLNEKAAALLDYIPHGSREEKIAFLKAFYDDEGSVAFKGNKKSVKGYQHSVPILELVQKLLAELSMYSRIDAKFFEIIISRRVDIIRFAQLVNFSEGLCVNGQRSNSIWKESLEKREILRRLIADYQYHIPKVNSSIH
jgi:hypothetical protein